MLPVTLSHSGAVKPLLFIGNKRSGTSHLVRLLNLVPDVFVCPEADLLWLLFQQQNQLPIDCYREDGNKALRRTVHLCADLIPAKMSVRDRFLAMAMRIRLAADAPPESLHWIGDKKPVQHCDPQLRKFIYDHFADARCLHLIRHPRSVVHSMRHQADGPMPWMHCWQKSPEELLEAWVRHEEWVIDMKHEQQLPILTIRYRDLANDAEATLNNIVKFLDVTVDDSILEQSRILTEPSSDSRYLHAPLDLTQAAQKLVDRYDL